MVKFAPIIVIAIIEGLALGLPNNVRVERSFGSGLLGGAGLGSILGSSSSRQSQGVLGHSQGGGLGSEQARGAHSVYESSRQGSHGIVPQQESVSYGQGSGGYGQGGGGYGQRSGGYGQGSSFHDISRQGYHGIGHSHGSGGFDHGQRVGHVLGSGGSGQETVSGVGSIYGHRHGYHGLGHSHSFGESGYDSNGEFRHTHGTGILSQLGHTHRNHNWGLEEGRGFGHSHGSEQENVGGTGIIHGLLHPVLRHGQGSSGSGYDGSIVNEGAQGSSGLYQHSLQHVYGHGDSGQAGVDGVKPNEDSGKLGYEDNVRYESVYESHQLENNKNTGSSTPGHETDSGYETTHGVNTDHLVHKETTESVSSVQKPGHKESYGQVYDQQSVSEVDSVYGNEKSHEGIPEQEHLQGGLVHEEITEVGTISENDKLRQKETSVPVNIDKSEHLEQHIVSGKETVFETDSLHQTGENVPEYVQGSDELGQLEGSHVKPTSEGDLGDEVSSVPNNLQQQGVGGVQSSDETDRPGGHEGSDGLQNGEGSGTFQREDTDGVGSYHGNRQLHNAENKYTQEHGNDELNPEPISEVGNAEHQTVEQKQQKISEPSSIQENNGLQPQGSNGFEHGNTDAELGRETVSGVRFVNRSSNLEGEGGDGRDHEQMHGSAELGQEQINEEGLEHKNTLLENEDSDLNHEHGDSEQKVSEVDTVHGYSKVEYEESSGVDHVNKNDNLEQNNVGTVESSGIGQENVEPEHDKDVHQGSIDGPDNVEPEGSRGLGYESNNQGPQVTDTDPQVTDTEPQVTDTEPQVADTEPIHGNDELDSGNGQVHGNDEDDLHNVNGEDTVQTSDELAPGDNSGLDNVHGSSTSGDQTVTRPGDNSELDNVHGSSTSSYQTVTRVEHIYETNKLGNDKNNGTEPVHKTDNVENAGTSSVSSYSESDHLAPEDSELDNIRGTSTGHRTVTRVEYTYESSKLGNDKSNGTSHVLESSNIEHTGVSGVKPHHGSDSLHHEQVGGEITQTVVNSGELPHGSGSLEQTEDGYAHGTSESGYGGVNRYHSHHGSGILHQIGLGHSHGSWEDHGGVHHHGYHHGSGLHRHYGWGHSHGSSEDHHGGVSHHGFSQESDRHRHFGWGHSHGSSEEHHGGVGRYESHHGGGILQHIGLGHSHGSSELGHGAGQYGSHHGSGRVGYEEESVHGSSGESHSVVQHVVSHTHSGNSFGSEGHHGGSGLGLERSGIGSALGAFRLGR